MNTKNLIAVTILTFLFGCVSTSNVINTGPDSFIVSASSSTSATSPTDSVYEEATKKCLALNKSFLQSNFYDETIKVSDEYGLTMTKARLEFRCLDPDHPAFQRADDRRESDKIIEIRN